MGLKVTFKEWIFLVLLFSVFLALTGFLINIYFQVDGILLTTVGLVIIFIIFKIQQWRSDDSDVDEPTEDE